MSNVGFLFGTIGPQGPTVETLIANPGGGPSPSAIQQVFVDKGGNDATGDGSQAKPFLTIQRALTSITDATTAKRYAVIVGPGTYADPFNVKPWIAIEGANNGSVFAGVTEISAPADSIGFDPSFATSGYSVTWFSYLTWDNHQTLDYTTIANQQIQGTFLACDFNAGFTFKGAGTGGVDNWTLDGCTVYGGLLAQGVQFLFTIGGTVFLGGTVTVQAAPSATATEGTTWLAQATSVGSASNPTNVHVLWAAPTPAGFASKLDWSGCSCTGQINLDGAHALASITGLRPANVIQSNGAPAPTFQPLSLELIFTASAANVLAALQAAGTLPQTGTLTARFEGYGGGGGSGGGQGGAAGSPGQGGGGGGGAHYCVATIDVNLGNGLDVNIGGGGSAGAAGAAATAGGNGGDGGDTNAVDHTLGNPLAGFIGAQGGNGGGSVLPFTPGGGGINFHGPSPRGVSGTVAAAGLEGCGGAGGLATIGGSNGNPAFVGLNQPGVVSGGGGGGLSAAGEGGGGGGGGGGPQKNGANGANGTAANGNPGNAGTANGGNGAGGGSGGAGAGNTGGAGAAGGSGWARLTFAIQ